MLTKSRLTTVLIALPLIIFFCAEAYFSFRYFFFKRPPYHFTLPPEPDGFFLVVWGRSDCKIENEFEIKFTDKKFACSPYRQRQGFAYDVYDTPNVSTQLFQDPKSGLNKIWHEEFLADKLNSDISYYIFFVGEKKLPKVEYEKTTEMRLKLINETL